MTRIAKCLNGVLIGCLLAASPVVGAGTKSLDASGAPRDFDPIAQPVVPEGVPVPVLVNDGSFEAGGNCGAGTSAWTEADSTQCTPWIGDWGPSSCLASIFPVSAVDGTQSFWAGGFCGAQNINTATQTVTIPADSNCTLTFWRASLMNGDDNSIFFISMDGVEIWTLGALIANDTGGVFVTDSVDFCAFGFTPGQTVSLQLGVRDTTLGGPGGNILFDFLEWQIAEPQAEFNVPTLGTLGLLALAAALGLASLVFLRRRSA